jgi:hypothetical protein
MEKALSPLAGDASSFDLSGSSAAQEPEPLVLSAHRLGS